MTARFARLVDELAAFASSVAVWLFVGLPVGSAAVGVAEAVGVPLPASTLELVAVGGAVCVVGLRAVDRRPSVARSLLFWVTCGAVTLSASAAALLFPTASGVDRAVAAVAPAVGVAVAYPLAFHGGYRRVAAAVDAHLGHARREA